MNTVTSADGTGIAVDRQGAGEPLVFVVGAFNERSTSAPLAAALADRYTTVGYDRRGRGDSGDTAPYAPEREVEDLAAVIDAVGGSASVFGYSSGAVLAMLAADSGLAITRLALYEPPTPFPGRDPGFWLGLGAEVEALVAAGDRGAAVELFQTRGVGIPQEVVAQLRHAPFWPALEGLASTLAYESRILASDPSLPNRVTTPTLVFSGGDSPDTLRGAAAAVADALPDGRLEVLPGQTHDLDAAAIAPVLAGFLG